MTDVNLMTNPMTAAGDLVKGGASGVPTRLALGPALQHLRVNAAGDDLEFADPPSPSGGSGSVELDYAEITSVASVTATDEATPQTIITGNAVSYDGSTIVMVDFFAPYAHLDNSAHTLYVALWDESAIVARLFLVGSTGDFSPVRAGYRFTPSAGAHTYRIRAHTAAATPQIGAGAASGANSYVPAFMRIVTA